MNSYREFREFVDLDDRDVERLQNLRDVVEPHAEAIVETFYDALTDHVHTRTVLGDDELARLRSSFHDWLLGAFDVPFDEEYAERQRTIGRLHEEVGIEPEYVFGGMNLVRTEIMEICMETDLEVPLPEAMTSVGRVLDLNATLMVDAYWEAVLEEKEQLGTELASFMAHEIRNPLNAVELNMTLLQRRLAETYDDPNEYLPMLEAVRSELERIEDLTQDIKEFAQPVSVTSTSHNLTDLIEELEASHSALFDAAEIEFETDIDDAAEIYCDPDRLKQVIINVLKNSVEAIDGEGRVVLTAAMEPRYTTMRISDTGEGLEPGSPNRIFELFYTTKASGTGLGLPIAKKIVEGHGGSIDIYDNDGEGTTVEMVLPRPADRDND